MVAPFENDDTIKRNFSYSEKCLMVDILNSKKIETFLQELANSLEVEPTNLVKVLKYLKIIKIIKKTKNIGTTKLFEIDRILLKHFIDEQEDYFVDNFHKKHNKFSYREPK